MLRSLGLEINVGLHPPLTLERRHLCIMSCGWQRVSHTLGAVSCIPGSVCQVIVAAIPGLCPRPPRDVVECVYGHYEKACYRSLGRLFRLLLLSIRYLPSF